MEIKRIARHLYRTLNTALLIALALLGASCSNIALEGVPEGSTGRALVSAPKTQINGFQWADTAGNPIQAHGGSLIKVGSFYYWFGENRQPDNHFESVACYRSPDLINWTFISHAISKTSAPELNYSWIERPKVIYNASTGKYAMWAHWENGDHYGEAKTMVAVADKVEGPYTMIKIFRPYEDRGVVDGWERKPGYMTRDQTLFVDDDGSAYFLASGNDNNDMRIFKLTADYLDVDYLVNDIFRAWAREAPAMFKRNGVYFLVTSGCTGWSPNQLKFSSSRSLTEGWNWDNHIGDWWGFASQPAYILEIPTVGGQSQYLYTGDRWGGAWGWSVNDSGYVWAPLNFTSDDTISMDWNNNINIDLAAASPVTAKNTYFRLKNKKSGLYLDVSGASTADGAAIIQWNSTSGDNQKFDLQYKGAGDYYLTSVKSWKNVEVPGWSTGAGTNLDQWSANNGNNQRWRITDIGNGIFTLFNMHSWKYLQVEGGSSSAGAFVEQGDYQAGLTSQQWILEPVN